MPRRGLKRIHVNRHIIDRNRKQGEREHPITVKKGRKNFYGSTVYVLDDDGNVVATIMYRPDKPLSCGATLYIETKNDCVVEEETV